MNKNYLGHSFILKETRYKNYYKYICERCNVAIYYESPGHYDLDEDEGEVFEQLELTCEEIIIKNIIE